MNAKIFISFSGHRSQRVATEVGQLIRQVLPVEPWTSDKIGEGDIWAESIHDALGKVVFGVSCITMENQVNPWIVFEAGAIGKTRDPSRWAIFLIDKNIKLFEPLGCYQCTVATKAGTKKLAKKIANVIKFRWTAKTENTFVTCWNRLDRVLKSIHEDRAPVPRTLPKVVANTLEIESTTPFRRWLRNRVLTTASLATDEIAMRKLLDRDEFRRRISNELKTHDPGACIAALCADKRLNKQATINYFRAFYHWAQKLHINDKKAGIPSSQSATIGRQKIRAMDRLRVCRIFVQPLKKNYPDVIKAHRDNAKFGVWPLIIPRRNRADLAGEYPELSARLNEGFGFVIFHSPTHTKVFTHVSPGKVISASDFTERANVQEIVILFDQLCDFVQGGQFSRTDPLWSEFLGRLNSFR